MSAKILVVDDEDNLRKLVQANLTARKYQEAKYHMESQQESCMLCAWREGCQKKFSLSGKDVRCPEFVRDVSIGKAGESAKKDA